MHQEKNPTLVDLGLACVSRLGSFYFYQGNRSNSGGTQPFGNNYLSNGRLTPPHSYQGGILVAVQSKNPTVVVESAPIQVFIPECCDWTPDYNEVAWDTVIDFLLRYLKGWLPGQPDGWRRTVLDKRDHSTHVIETIPEGEWPNLRAPGIPGKLARSAYETTRKMDGETALRILAKFPRHRRMTPERITETARKIATDPVLKENLVPRRFKH